MKRAGGVRAMLAGHLPHPFARGMAIAWGALALALTFTLASWRHAARGADWKAEQDFQLESQQVRDAIRERMTDYEQVLRGAAALFAASVAVERHEWKSYVEAMKVERRFPGVQGIGFTQVVAPRKREAHIRAVRAEGFPDYRIHPAGERAEYTSIVYLEPFAGRNLRAFGYDMFTEPVRRAAMERARDTGEAALSGRVTLLQETEQDVQAGFLLYLPVYRNDAPQATREERRAALAGYVYAPFRMKDLMRGILGARPTQLDLEIYDGADASSAALMHDDARHGPAPARFVRDMPLEASGRAWTLRLSSTPAFEAEAANPYPQLILGGGAAVSLLVFLLIAATLAAREKGLRARNILDSALDAIVIIDGDGRVVEFNPSAARVFGYRRDQALGRDLADLVIPPAYREAHRQGLARLRKSGAPRALGRVLEMRALHADGGEFPVELTVVPVTGVEPPLFAAFVRDITETKQALARLRESEETYRALFESAHDAIMTLAPPSWSFTSGNPATVRIFGVKDEAEFVALTPWQLSPETQPDGRLSAEKARDMIDTAMRHGVHYFEWTHRRLGRESFPATVLLTRVERAGQVFLQATVRDISAQRRAEAALRESEERFREMFEHAPQAVFMADEGGAIALANAQAEKMFGYGREELLGRSVDTLVPERVRTEHARLRAAFAGAPEARAMGRGRYLFARRKDGSELPVEIGLSPVRTGGRSYVLVSVVDITDLRRAQHATEEALRAKTDFMSNVTHELRTPLNSVIGFAELLKDGVPGPLNEKQAQFVADIHESGLRLLKLVEGMLEMSRLDADGAVLEREPVDIGAVLAERAAAHREAAEARHVSITLEPAADAGSAPLDPRTLRRMLDALIDNAIKFNREGGRVALKAHRDGDRLAITVADTGIGIAPADLAKLFKPLVQLDAGLDRWHGGIGLGLALARRLAELHGGTIEVASEPGTGSTFTLCLPLREKS